MRILHISTFENAGAGIAAKRIHLGMLDQGIESSLLLLHGKEDRRNKIFIYRPEGNKLIRKLRIILKKYF
jgi:hypothetical protein